MQSKDAVKFWLEGRWYAYDKRMHAQRFFSELYLNMSILIRFRGAKLHAQGI